MLLSLTIATASQLDRSSYTAIMDTLNTPDGGRQPSSLMDRQASQASTTPLLNTQPSTEDQISPDQGKLGASTNNTNNYTQAQNGDHSKINGGDQKVEVVVDVTSDGGGAGSLRNGAKAATTEPSGGLEEEGLNRRGTAIPIREEFHCRRFWFFYHDLRALTTSVSLTIIMLF